MNNELYKSLSTAYFRTKKSKYNYYIIPASNGFSISKFVYSTVFTKLYYSINQEGIVFRHDDGQLYNLGPIDFINCSAYI